MLPRLAWNSQSSCFHLPNAGITGVPHHTQLKYNIVYLGVFKAYDVMCVFKACFPELVLLGMLPTLCVSVLNHQGLISVLVLARSK
jgi:hypothetical protein